jgi:hypothetical protein
MYPRGVLVLVFQVDLHRPLFQQFRLWLLCSPILWQFHVLPMSIAISYFI